MNDENNVMNSRPHRLAWHETLELHELVAMQSVCLMKSKKMISEIQEHELRSLYAQTIRDVETNLRELLQFYPEAARDDQEETGMRKLEAGFYAGELLAFSKVAVKSYAAAITETATPSLRDTFNKHLQKAIDCHTKVFNYMYKHGLYPAYDLEKLLENDMKNAKKALSMTY